MKKTLLALPALSPGNHSGTTQASRARSRHSATIHRARSCPARLAIAAFLFLAGLFLATGPSQAADVPGAALAFDGVNDRVTLPDISPITSGVPGEYTVEVWVKLDSYAGGLGMMIYGDERNANRGILLQIDGSGHPWTFHPDPGVGIVTAAAVVPLNTWTHLAFVQDAARLALYTNGVFAETLLNAPYLHQETSDREYLGAFTDNHSSFSRFLHGRLDEVRVWSRALTDNEIQNKWNCELAGTESGLVAYYKCNQGVAGEPNASLTTLEDATANNNDGALNNFALNGTTSNWIEPGGVVTGTSCGPRYAHDLFASGIAISGLPVSVAGTNVNATKESGEPNHDGNPGGKSVWWTWTNGPATRNVTVDTRGSSFPVLLAVYTGTAVTNLTLVASDVQIGENDAVQVFTAVAGTIYQIAVDGYNGASGNISLHLNAAAPPGSGGEAYTFTTLAGLPLRGNIDGTGSNARFNQLEGVAVDRAGNVYVADRENQTIRKITAAGVVTTIAGFPGFSGTNDGTGSGARFFSPIGIAVDSATNLYVTEIGNHTIRRITPNGTNWVVTTIAGFPGVSGSANGTGSDAQFNVPAFIAVDGATNLYVSDTYNHTIRKITPNGANWVVTTIAGFPGVSGSDDGTGSDARFYQPHGIAVDGANNLYVADYNNTIRKITPNGTNWVVKTIATSGVFSPRGVAVDSATNLYVAQYGLESDYRSILKITNNGTTWNVNILAGSSIGTSDGTAANAHFYLPSGIAVDSAGNLYVADRAALQVGTEAVRKVTAAGVVTRLAGAPDFTLLADGTGSDAVFYKPDGIAVDREGNVYVAEAEAHRIRKITSAGVVTTIGGGIANGHADGIGSNAKFNGPKGLAVDSALNVYVAEIQNHTIRKISAAGVVTTIAGMAMISGTNDGTGSNARFNQPFGIAVDGAGNLYVADTYNHTIRKITPMGANWVVTTIARFDSPRRVAVDSASNLYVAQGDTIRKITPNGTNWVEKTLAGFAESRGTHDGIRSMARFSAPFDVAVDREFNVYVADTDNFLVRKITSSGVVTTIAGLAGTPGSADGTGSSARFGIDMDGSPFGIAVDSDGSLYVTDRPNHSIRKGVFTQFAPINPAPYPQPLMNGRLVVTLEPPQANGQWRFPWELGWHNSGVTVSNLVAGNYDVEFRDRPGWLAIPPSVSVAVTNGGTTPLTNQYYPTLSELDPNGAGTLTVKIEPNPPGGSGWRFIGDGTPFPGLPPGYSTNLLAGTYLIEFAPVSGRARPSSQAVQVSAGAVTVVSVNYLLAVTNPPGKLLPFPVPANQISDLNNFPFGFNGQLQSDHGYGSGVAVDSHVVLTAAHLVFNDQTFSYVSQAYWYFQREAGVFEPKPQAARAWNVLSGYAAQRTNDLQIYAPDTSTPQSRNLDVAALYFAEPVAGGGHGGYLPSATVPSPWLTGNNLKMLVGYPVDGSQFGNANIVAGRMYQTEPQTSPLSLASDPVANQQVYMASWFLSYRGNSGGPVYAQLNGYYYPAGVYLGTLYNGIEPIGSAVRAIDSEVTNLIAQAAIRGYTGSNYTGGGVITIIASQVSIANKGYVKFRLAPPEAVGAGAGWRLRGGPSTAYCSISTCTLFVTSTAPVVVEFNSIRGWNLPVNQALIVSGGQSITNDAAYTRIVSSSWTSATSGQWEATTNWSDGAPYANESIYITNAATKTVTLDAATSSASTNSPANTNAMTFGNLTVSNLTVSAPPGATNTLFLTGTGAATPLRVTDNFTLLSGGALDVRPAAVLEVKRAVDFGEMNINGGTMIISNSLSVGVGDCTNGVAGRVNLSSGTLVVTNRGRTNFLIISNGTFTMTGGTLILDKLILTNACGHFSRTGGMIITNSPGPNAVILGPTLDADGDGFSNAAESAGGTDPLNAASAPAAPVSPALTITRSNAIVRITWPATSAFRPQETTNLNPANWSNSTNAITTNGAIKTITISTSTGRKFYRLIFP